MNNWDFKHAYHAYPNAYHAYHAYSNQDYDPSQIQIQNCFHQEKQWKTQLFQKVKFYQKYPKKSL